MDEAANVDSKIKGYKVSIKLIHDIYLLENIRSHCFISNLGSSINYNGSPNTFCFNHNKIKE